MHKQKNREQDIQALQKRRELVSEKLHRIETQKILETASAILGHSGLNITQVYVHRDNRTAAAWAAVHG